MARDLLNLLLLLAVVPSAAIAQDTPPSEETIRVKDVRETLTFLAGDRLAGRDTPSPALTEAARFIAGKFRQAGLDPLPDETYLHRYEAAGHRYDSKKLKVAVTIGDRRIELKPDEDVRLYRGGRALAGEDLEVARMRIEDATSRRFWRGRRVRKPVLLEVPADSPFWAQAAGRRDVLESRRSMGAPILLVRRGVLPDGPATATLDVPGPEEIRLSLENVVGLKPGRGRPDEQVLVSAHFDHIGIGLPRDGDFIYNGADDDASGTTAIIHLALALARRKEPLRRSVAFVCFSGEEKGLIGSRAYAEHPPWPLEKVAANINVEMIGRPPEDGRRKAWVTGRAYSDFEDIARGAFERAGIELTTFPLEGRLFGASDNYMLARRGVVAHSISAGSLHRDYHQPSDEVDKIDFEHLTAVIRGLYEVVVEFADREERPAYNDRGLTVLQLPKPQDVK